MPESFDPYHKWLGIRPKDQPPHHYRLLGIDLFENDPDVISSAADQRMAHVRSFQTGRNSVLSQKLLNEIAAARVCLLDGKKKREYDLYLQGRIFTPPSSPSAAPPSSPSLPGDEYPLKAPAPPPPEAEEAPVLFTPPRRSTPRPRPRRKFGSELTVFVILFVIVGVIVVLGSLKSPDQPPPPAKSPSSAPTVKPPAALPPPKSVAPSQRPSAPSPPKSPLPNPDRKDEKPPPETVSPSPSPSKPHDGSTAEDKETPAPAGRPSPPATAPKPEAPKPAPPARPRPAPESFRIPLPDDKPFDSKIFDVNLGAVQNKLMQAARHGGSVLDLRSAPTRIDGLISITRGSQPHGEVLTFYRNQKVKTYAVYLRGHREGVVKNWLDDGDRCFWGQYHAGSPNGFCCFFVGNTPRLLIEYTIGKIHALHVLQDLRVEKSYANLEEAQADPLAGETVKEYAEVVKELAQNEIELREMIKKAIAKKRRPMGR
ncbi:MAG: hypothetical protein JXB10_05940 [Pirellulales bacterium]|nr:hypothetical protein [Pirellulales bacterium]